MKYPPRATYFDPLNMTSRESRDHWLQMDDARLAADCHFDAYRASGPGGQKRNKTSSAVRLRHKPSGLIAIAEESRSQHENKAKAIRRLRLMIALQIRCPWDDPSPIIREHRNQSGGFEISTRHSIYPRLAAAVLDCLEARQGSVSDAGSALDVRTAQLSRFLTRDQKLLSAANQIREKWGLKPLRPASG